MHLNAYQITQVCRYPKYHISEILIMHFVQLMLLYEKEILCEIYDKQNRKHRKI